MKLLRLAPENTKFPFMRFRRVSYPFSAVLSIVSVLLFLFVGMNFGIDFSGGTLLEVQAKSGNADLSYIRDLSEHLNLGDLEVQGFGTPADASIRFGMQPGGDVAQQAAVGKVKQALGDAYEFRRVEVVGPRVSGELVQQGTLGVVMSILAVLAYLWFRFEWQFAIGAIIATMHDLLLTVGFFSITQLEFNTTSIAAILTIVGYSLNETVVVLDRIREMMRKYKKMPTDQLIDMSVNAVLPRTLMTATTVFLALLSLVIFGGQVIRSFSLAMMWGIFVATYSSIFICSPTLIYLGLRNERVARDETTAGAKPLKSGKFLSESRKYGGFLPGAHLISGMGRGAFEFGGMSHVGSLLFLPDGVRAIAATRFGEVDEAVLAPVFALPRGAVELLLFGCGPSLQPVPTALRKKLLDHGVRCDPMSTGNAAQTYNILLGEKRLAGALLIAVD